MIFLNIIFFLGQRCLFYRKNVYIYSFIEIMIVRITIQGLVQGVGFRPFIYLLAESLNIKGEVANRTNGLIIQAELGEEQLNIFLERIKTECPPVSVIHSVEVELLEDSTIRYTTFEIVKSKTGVQEITQVAPDIAVCPACLSDRKIQEHRHNYPFINCTHCGPRFSIVKELPYDRINTTMSAFPMCELCHDEYTDIHNRRFHAQPIACNHCGPVYYSRYNNTDICDYSILLKLTVELINKGEVIAVKGIGGYHLVCDAQSSDAVEKLRKIKHRDTKPFAVMFANEEQLKEYTYCNESELEMLTSWRRPIVILRQSKALAKGINDGMNTLGSILPYMPIHYDWFDDLNTPALIMTSGNLSELPIAITPKEANDQFGNKVALILHHNRDVHNRVDDSVVQVCNSLPCIMRRSRGYVPEPFFTDMDVEGILAFGAEKTNTFALGKSNTCIQSQYIGDLKNWETFLFYKESIQRFQNLFRFTPSLLVCDLHPDYLSSRYAEEFSEEKQLPLIRVQHHHAHAAACLLEYGLTEKVIAVIWDGVGLGDDGHVWGGEFFLCNRENYSRLSHFEYIPMPGGDLASKEPWRMAVAYLHHYKLPIPQAFIERVGVKKIDYVIDMMGKNLNCPLTSSAGRMFDAFASLLGLCDIATHQAQAPTLLEQCASDCMQDSYEIDASDVISVRPMLMQIIDDMERQVSVGDISAKIHNTLAKLILDEAKKQIQSTETEKLILSGGCFQNKRLVEHLQDLFSQDKISLYIPSKIPCNDGGIAAGQLAIAAARIQNRKNNA